MRYLCVFLSLAAVSIAAAQNQGDAKEPNSPAQAQEQIKVTLPPGIGQKAAALEGLKWIKGKPVKIEPGKAYLIEFWATWCAPCRESIPHLTELQKTYAGKITVIGVSIEKPETITSFVEKMGDQMDYTIAADTEGKVVKNYSEAHNQQAIPHGFIVDQAGKIVWYGHPTEGMDYVLSQVAEGKFDAMEFARQKAEAEALNARLSGWYTQYFEMVQAAGYSEQSDKIAEQFIEQGHPEALLTFAWNNLVKFKNCPGCSKVALKAAEKANQLTNGSEPMVLDTYATALYENGKLDEAIAAQQRAIALALGNLQMQGIFQKKLLEYKNKQFKQKN